MKKIKLGLEALKVESFDLGAGLARRGTVEALSETETRIGRTECRACPSDATCWPQDTCGTYCTDEWPSCASGCDAC